MPNINQQTIQRSPTVIKILYSFHTGKHMQLRRKSWHDKVFFAMNACNDACNCGNVKIGDILIQTTKFL